jgi:hypothetical protein
MFGLRGYVSELQFTVTALLIDRSLGNSGLHRNKFFVICIEPQHGLRRELRILCNLEHLHSPPK